MYGYFKLEGIKIKRIIAFMLSLIITALSLAGARQYLEYQIHKAYFEQMGDNNSEDKFKSLILESEAAKTGDNLFIFGSSELWTIKGQTPHASSFFADKKDGFQIDLVGKAGYQNIIHAINFGAMGTRLKDQKVVFFLSPQWFGPEGIGQNTLLANSSEEEIYSLFLNPDISHALKVRLASRLSYIIKDDKDFKTLKIFCDLYSRDNWMTKTGLTVTKPFFQFVNYLLELKDDIKAYNLLQTTLSSMQKSNQKPSYADVKTGRSTFDWNNEMDKATALAKTKTNNNEFNLDNGFYNQRKNEMNSLKGAMKKSSYIRSNEYKDFILLLDICKEVGIKPLIVNIPVNGVWYDYGQHSVSDRQQYYENINTIVKSHGFQLADFSKYEYETYFLSDGSHLGWRGWIHVNKALDEYYYSK